MTECTPPPDTSTPRVLTPEVNDILDGLETVICTLHRLQREGVATVAVVQTVVNIMRGFTQTLFNPHASDTHSN